ncbi:hypothetical protein [Mucilaginibacter terrae]|uniref:t-SNARE complex subunit (Syntaxin) n=1 Tax=Mucilaginibacter terrae TaxID=1955052 RepID=A0ABU3GVT6_9SPHI|nr:hypothetical protein [Mucilaginibacter terrae]MDT3402740.1 t-SNARE complex subunit (syntaxin) [Mucilaginibacter terrae]
MAKRLLDTDDEELLQQLKNVFENYQLQTNDLPDYVKAGIARAQEQAAAGLLTPHDAVMEKYKRYL